MQMYVSRAASLAASSNLGRSISLSHRFCCCRGSPCELPEETLEGYAAAFDAGVDFIELDAVSACLSPALPVTHGICRLLAYLASSVNTGLAWSMSPYCSVVHAPHLVHAPYCSNGVLVHTWVWDRFSNSALEL